MVVLFIPAFPISAFKMYAKQYTNLSSHHNLLKMRCVINGYLNRSDKVQSGFMQNRKKAGPSRCITTIYGGFSTL
jgi:hypothetical protein